MRLFLSVISGLLLALQLTGQEKDVHDFFCPRNDYSSFGFYLGLGGSRSLPGSVSSDLDLIVSESTRYTAQLSPEGRWGTGVDGGLFAVPKQGPIRLMDVGLRYRSFKGAERLSAQRGPLSDRSFPEEILSTGEFDYKRLSLELDLKMLVQLHERYLFQHGPGFLADKSFDVDSQYEVPHLELPTAAPDQGTIVSLTYTAGFIYKLSPGKFLDMYAKAPLMSTGGEVEAGSERIFSSTYRNLLIGVRYRWLQAKPDRLCPAFGNYSKGSKSRSARPKSRPW